MEGRLDEGEAPRGPQTLLLALDEEELVRAISGGPTVPTDAAPGPDADFTLGHYRLLSRVGAGGMGVVLLAIDDHLGRKVAIKLLRSRGDERSRQNLAREAQALARLSHPGVVQVYEVVFEGDLVYVVMEYVPGRTLRAWQEQSDRAWRTVLACYLEAGSGLAAAHAAGLVHRDFKPDNVLVADDGRVKVVDFGLARERTAIYDGEAAGIEPPPGTGSTRTAGLAGTPAYMAPEQFRGEELDARSDQFGFCVALYEALYGEHPFVEGDLGSIAPREVIDAALHGRVREPPRGTQVPAWLRRVLLRGLSLAARDRYASMEELIADIDEQRRQGRRTMLGLLALGVLSIAAAGSAYAARAFRAQSERATRAFAESQVEGARSAHVSGDFTSARAKLRSALETMDSRAGRALWWTLTSERLWWKLDGHPVSLAFDPVGRRIALGGAGALEALDLDTAAIVPVRGVHDVVAAVDFDPTGTRLVFVTETGMVGTWDTASARVSDLVRIESRLTSVAFTPTGERVVVGAIDRVVRVVDAADGHTVAELAGHDAPVMAVAAGDRGWASTDAAYGVWWWPATGEPGTPLRPARGADERTETVRTFVGVSLVDGALVMPDGPRAVEIRPAHDRSSTALRLEVPGDTIHDASVTDDGTRVIAACASGAIRVWDRRTGDLLDEFDSGTSQPRELAIDDERDLVVVVGSDVRALRLAKPVVDRPHRGHDAPVDAVAISRDGRMVASAGDDRMVLVWREDGHELHRFEGHQDSVYALDFSPDGRLLASAGLDRTIFVWDLGARSVVRVLPGSAPFADVAFFPDGRRLASVGWDRKLRLWDVESGAEIAGFVHSEELVAVAIDPSGRWIAVGGAGSAAWVRDLDTGEVREIPGEGGHWTVAFSGARSWMIGGIEGVRSIAGDGSLRARFDVPGSRPLRGAYDPHTHTLAVPYDDGIIRVWTGSVGPRELRGHRGMVNAADVHGPGAIVVSAGDDRSVRSWSTRGDGARWRGAGLIDDGKFTHTHRGWHGGRAPEPGKWVAAVERAARVAASGDVVCVVGTGGGLEIWDRSRDERVIDEPGVHVTAIAATSLGCLVHDGSALGLRGAGGLSWSHPAQVFAVIPGAVLVRDGERIVELDTTTGGELRAIPGGDGVTALTRIGDRIVLGFEDGTLALAPGAADSPTPTFERGTDGAATLRPGPAGTIVAGFVDGTVGLWDPTDGRALGRAKLHGPVIDVAYRPGTVVVLTALGDVLELDVTAFELPHCVLLSRVWSQTPVTWVHGRAVVESPADHPCMDAAR